MRSHHHPLYSGLLERFKRAVPPASPPLLEYTPRNQRVDIPEVGKAFLCSSNQHPFEYAISVTNECLVCTTYYEKYMELYAMPEA